MKTTEALPHDGEEERITRAAGIIGLATLMSRILGLIRDMVMAAVFGAGLAADAYYVAYRIPSILRELFAEGSISAGFIPVFTEYLKKRAREEAKRLVHAAFTLILLGLAAISGLGILLAPWLVQAIAWGFGDDVYKFDLTTLLTKVMFPYLLFIGLAALAMGVHNSLRSFGTPAVAPAIFNLCVIGAILSISPFLGEPILGAAIGILIGGLAQWLVQLPGLYRRSMGLGFRWAPRDEGIRRIGLLLMPVVLGLAVSQINILVNTLFASFLPDGSVTYLYYGIRLIHFPLGIFGIALATALLPSLAAQAADLAHGRLRQTLSFGLRTVFFICFPALIGLIWLRVPIVHLLFQHGEFDYHATLGTAGAVVGYAVGLWAFAGVRIVVSAFYALQDTRTPVKIAITAVLANIILCLLLMPWLQHVGLALAASLASILNFSLLVWKLHRKGLNLIEWRRIAGSIGRTAAACIVLAFVCHWVAGQGIWIMEGYWVSKSFWLAGGIAGGAAVYFLAHLFMKSDELFFLFGAIRKKIR